MSPRSLPSMLCRVLTVALGAGARGWVIVALWIGGFGSAAAQAPAAVKKAPSAAVAASATASHAAVAEPLTYEADKGQADLAKKRYTLKGRVRVRQGELDIRAHEAVVQQQADGTATVVVTGAAGEPARFEQKKALTQESLVGQSQRIDYDNRSQIVVMRGSAALKRYQNGRLVDEVQGSVITYNQITEAFQVDGADAKPSGGDDGAGRVRGVLSSGSPEGAK